MNANLKANELAALMLQSNEFREIKQAKQLIDSNKEYLGKIKELKEKQFNFQVSLAPNKQPDKSKMDSIKKYYDELMKNTDLKRYLEAEKKFNEYVAGLFKIINDKIENSLK